VSRIAREGALRIALFVTLLVAAGCAAPASFHEARPEMELQWPDASSGSKIVWIKTITGYQDVGITKGFWKRFKEFFVGEDDYRIVRPHGVLATGNEQVYIADPGRGVVHCMDYRRGRYTVIGDEDDSPLRTPIGLAEDGQGRLYITDPATGTVYRYDPADDLLKPFLSGVLARPTGIAFNETNGLLYIVDTIGQQVIAYDLGGKERLRIGASADGAGLFNYPTDIAIDELGQLYVTDALNFRIRVFTPEGVPVSQFGNAGDARGDMNRPKGLALDSIGHIYVCDALFDAVQIFDREGRLLLSFGRQGSAPGEFWMPSGIFIDRQNFIYVSDTYNRRVQVFRYLEGTEPYPKE
jgi:sugar lactone lactonase YvrE